MEGNLGSQFIWWVGVVESRQDPKRVGRCQVRIVGSHTDMKSTIPTEDLPWAHPIIPVNDTASLQIKEGDYVVGFYLDGPESQVPIIMGILPGIPTKRPSPTSGFADPRVGAELSSAPKKPLSVTPVIGGAIIVEGIPSRYPENLNEPTFSRLSRNEKISQTPIQGKKTSISVAVPTAGPGTWSEPATPYAAEYPYNRVMETESGHILEFDDTPGAERIHIYHRSGTSEETHPDGTKVTRINKDAFEIVLSDKNIYVKGDLNITTVGNINLKAGMNVNIEAGLNIVMNALGSVTTQAVLGIFGSTIGPMALNGLPINWNGPPVVVLPPPLPVTGV
jgi:Gp5 N-terminal OB domain